MGCLTSRSNNGKGSRTRRNSPLHLDQNTTVYMTHEHAGHKETVQTIHVHLKTSKKLRKSPSQYLSPSIEKEQEIVDKHWRQIVAQTNHKPNKASIAPGHFAVKSQYSTDRKMEMPTTPMATRERDKKETKGYYQILLGRERIEKHESGGGKGRKRYGNEGANVNETNNAIVQLGSKNLIKPGIVELVTTKARPNVRSVSPIHKLTTNPSPPICLGTKQFAIQSRRPSQKLPASPFQESDKSNTAGPLRPANVQTTTAKANPIATVAQKPPQSENEMEAMRTESKPAIGRKPRRRREDRLKAGQDRAKPPPYPRSTEPQPNTEGQEMTGGLGLCRPLSKAGRAEQTLKSNHKPSDPGSPMANGSKRKEVKCG